MIGFNENNKEQLLQSQLRNAIKKQRPDVSKDLMSRLKICK
jgi:hypothetical protein